MANTEPSTCMRCGNLFQCTPFDIANCQCSAVQLGDEERTYISTFYDDCLCANCLTQLKQQYADIQRNIFFRRTAIR